MSNTHHYRASVSWEGNTGDGTRAYRSYSRSYRIEIEDKLPLHGSADPHFRGDPQRHNPEDLLLGALSACHMLTYLALCSRNGIDVQAYADDAAATMLLREDGGGAFREAILRPRVTVADEASIDRARELHETAHGLCFISQSVVFPVTIEPTFTLAALSSQGEADV